jgi:hypothetical protein
MLNVFFDIISCIPQDELKRQAKVAIETAEDDTRKERLKGVAHCLVVEHKIRIDMKMEASELRALMTGNVLEIEALEKELRETKVMILCVHYFPILALLIDQQEEAAIEHAKLSKSVQDYMDVQDALDSEIKSFQSQQVLKCRFCVLMGSNAAVHRINRMKDTRWK